MPEMGKHQPICNLAHALVNQLSIIVGCCELMRDEPDENPIRRQQLERIRSVAMEMARVLQRQQCDLRVLLQEAARKPISSSQPPCGKVEVSSDT
jgi:hypothetical protein